MLRTVIVILCMYLLIPNLLRASKVYISSQQQFEELMKQQIITDSIIWKNGNYKNLKLKFQPKQISNTKSIFLLAEEPGKVLFTGNSSLVISGTNLVVNGFMFTKPDSLQDGHIAIEFGEQSAKAVASNHCRVTNCAFIDFSPNDEELGTNYIVLRGINNEVDHCYFMGKTNKGPVMVVRYFTKDGYVEGSEEAPSTYHHVHHNYFGFRTYSKNGGEDIRVGDSKTSHTKGFNVFEYNFFEDQKIEAEVISNKSCDNIYRFNTLINNDGALVLRHGNRCIVYGNYIASTQFPNKSGGIRIIGSNHTVFSNYISGIAGGIKDNLKAGMVIMCGYPNAPLNGYHPADSCVVANNILQGCHDVNIKVGVANKNKSNEVECPKGIMLLNNYVYKLQGTEPLAVKIYNEVNFKQSKFNYYSNGSADIKDGFSQKLDTTAETLSYTLSLINDRLAKHNIIINLNEFKSYNQLQPITKSSIGVTWIKN